MRSSFDDEESFKGVVESLRFNRSDPNLNAQQQIGLGSSNSMPLQECESENLRNEGNSITSNDPITLRRVGSSSIQETRRTRSGDVEVYGSPACPGEE